MCEVLSGAGAIRCCQAEHASLAPALKQIFFIGDGLTTGGTVKLALAGFPRNPGSNLPIVLIRH